jgi:putative ABC transport system ATP-binding protein
VSLARSLANSPEVLLLDEPTSSLDAAAKAYVERLISQVVRANRLTCIAVTHDMEQAARMADRVMIMRSGRVERIGPKEQVLNAEGAI